MRVVFSPSFLCVWNRMPRRKQQCCAYSFDDLTDCQNLRGCEAFPSKAILSIHLKNPSISGQKRPRSNVL